MLSHGLRLGAVSYRLAPLYAYWRPHFKVWLIVPIAVLGAYIVWLRRTRVATSLTDRAAVLAFTAFSLAITTGVAISDGGPRAIIAPLLRADLEYTGAIERVHGVAQFLRDYPTLAGTMPMHARVHPPGAVLFVWSASQLFGSGPWSTGGAIVLFSALAVPLVYRWATRLGGPGVARRATAIFVLTPSVVLFTATSMDAPFAVLLIATMAIYWESTERRPVLLGCLAGVAASAAALMTYSVSVALLFCGMAACIRYLTATAPRQNIITSACCAFAAFLASHALLWLTTGYDPIQMFFAALANHTHIMSGTRHETPTRYLHLAVANLVVFFIACGLPCAIIWWSTIIQYLNPRTHASSVRSAGRDTPSSESPPPVTCEYHLRNFTWTALITLFAAAAVPMYVLEVERIWMFLVPLVVIPIGRNLFEQERGTGEIQGTVAVATLVAAQTLVTEILLTTYW